MYRWKAAPLTSARADEAAALYRLFFQQEWERPWSSAEFAALLATPGCFGFLLVDEALSARGLILLRMAADEAEILTLGVAPRCRRAGGASRLLQQAITHSIERGARTLFLEVASDNAPARLFYERHGFSPIGRRPSYYDRGTAPAADALAMSRTL